MLFVKYISINFAIVIIIGLYIFNIDNYDRLKIKIIANQI